ncbi:MAG: carbamoyltransferase HypF [Puniceicoccaceae bacterium]
MRSPTLLKIRGIVQGVGFRPFVARTADSCGMNGWVMNDAQGVTILLRNTRTEVDAFIHLLHTQLPPAARIDSLEKSICESDTLDEGSTEGFRILPSPEAGNARDAAVTPDLCLCEDCRRELLDSADRRFNYPFINCTNCGPRYSIIRELPYDRERTTMAEFPMCSKCAKEYTDALDRRYHAQPNACPDCGPRLTALDSDGNLLGQHSEALDAVLSVLRNGGIAAVKGLGGYHLFTDAMLESSVKELRRRKHREEKPLAVMFSSLDQLREYAIVTEDEENLLESTASPIVLVKQLQESNLAPSLSPGNPRIGAFLPYTPLHVLLMQNLASPMVATSANISEEPLCTDNEEAIRRLKDIADIFLVHDRRIARAVDDSVQRIASCGPILLRRARGYAPDPIPLPGDCVVDSSLLAVGGHLKNTISVALPGKVITSPHIGDLSNALAIEAFRNSITLLSSLYGKEPETIACDLHPDYASTRHAVESDLPLVPVQHHLAHVLACMLEHTDANGVGPRQVLGVSWDGTGYGEDGSIWGGEFILVDRDAGTAKRVGHLLPFQLPGGEAAVRETSRSCLGALHAAGLADTEFGKQILQERYPDGPDKIHTLRSAIDKGVNSPVTTSAGRLFDAVASILGTATRNSFEGQAGMSVEFAATGARTEKALPWTASQEEAIVIDWSPCLEQLCKEVVSGADRTVLAMQFHRTLAETVLHVANHCGVEDVVLTGGCFQNAILTELTHDLLTRNKFNALLHQRLSPNDNSISAGQVLGALWGITRVTP